jgi:fucose permease
VGIAGLALLGFSLAPIYPGMMTQTPTRLGRLSEHAVGFQVAAAMLGAVAVPSLGGYLMQTFGHAWLNGMLGVLAVMLWLAIAALFWGARLEKGAAV